MSIARDKLESHLKLRGIDIIAHSNNREATCFLMDVIPAGVTDSDAVGMPMQVEVSFIGERDHEVGCKMRGRFMDLEEIAVFLERSVPIGDYLDFINRVNVQQMTCATFVYNAEQRGIDFRLGVPFLRSSFTGEFIDNMLSSLRRDLSAALDAFWKGAAVELYRLSKSKKRTHSTTRGVSKERK